jgi:glycosyltransferase involved in cell wall biosynthesis
MKLSFVIPAYNEEACLGQCLDSILKQTRQSPHGQDIEIIVVNNASTDRTAELARSFPEVIVVDEPRKGLLYARQAGFATATGELIANVDADTMLTPGWVETVLRHFGRSDRLVALSGPFIYHDGSLLTNIVVRIYYYAAYLSYLGNRFILRMGSMMQGGNFVIRRTALEAINGFNTSLSFYGEDTDISWRLHKIGAVRFTFRLPIYSSARRIHSEGLIVTGYRYIVNYFWIILFKRAYHTKYSDVRERHNTSHTTVRQMSLAMHAVRIALVVAVVATAGAIMAQGTHHYAMASLKYYITELRK